MSSVHELPQRRGVSRTKRPEIDQFWEKRQAMMLAGQLPEDPASALRVLKHTEELVTSFLKPAAS